MLNPNKIKVETFKLSRHNEEVLCRECGAKDLVCVSQICHGETKATCLWLKGLPLLQPTKVVDGRDARVWRMPPSPERAKLRSKTYIGIAEAMASQWG